MRTRGKSSRHRQALSFDEEHRRSFGLPQESAMNLSGVAAPLCDVLFAAATVCNLARLTV